MDSVEVPDAKVLRRAATASLVGSAVEWYDYFIFGTASALVFGELFFPAASTLAGTLSAFAVFGVGFLARPIGGLIFGRLGDRIGRKSVLVMTLLIMGLGTFLIGVLPTFSAIGVFAPVLLVILRLVQGFGVGGEWGGAALVAVENAPGHKRGRFGSFAQMGTGIGVALSTGIFALMSMLPDEQFLAWGWRVPFLVSIVLVGFGFWVRKRLTETPEFEKLRDAGALSKSPVTDTLRTQRKPLLLAIGMRFSENIFGYVVLTFSLTYATQQVGSDRTVVLWGTVAAALIGCVAYYAAAAISDQVGRKPVFLAGAVFAGLFSVPFFWLLDTNSSPLIWLALTLGWGVAAGCQYSIQPAYFSELFGARLRYTGLSMGYQFGAVFSGGFAPFIATALLAVGGGNPWLVAIYLLSAAILSAVCVIAASDPYRVQLRAAKPDQLQHAAPVSSEHVH